MRNDLEFRSIDREVGYEEREMILCLEGPRDGKKRKID